jgi:type I restriction enzyme S subunit
MEKFYLPRPSREEQRKIASIFYTFDKSVEQEESYKERLQQLKQALMRDLLSGEVRTTDVDIDIPQEVAKYA